VAAAKLAPGKTLSVLHPTAFGVSTAVMMTLSLRTRWSRPKGPAARATLPRRPARAPRSGVDRNVLIVSAQLLRAPCSIHFLIVSSWVAVIPPLGGICEPEPPAA